MISDPFGSWDSDPLKDTGIKVTHLEPSLSASGEHRDRRNRMNITNLRSIVV